MQYREVGNTGKKVGVVGLGCEHLDNQPFEFVRETIAAALHYGVNLMDVFMPGQQVRENIANALGSRRGEVLIQGHIGSTDIGQQYDISRDLPTVKKYFEAMLSLFGYIDFGMMFFIDSQADYDGVFNTGFIDYVQSLKQKGDIHHIGFSSHNPVMAAKVVATGVPELMMFSINPAFDRQPPEKYVLDSLEDLPKAQIHGTDPVRARLYSLCAQHGVGITVMKTYGAGKLLQAEHTPFSAPLTEAQCIQYALDRPAVAAVLPGCRGAAQVEAAMAYFAASDEERDYSAILQAAPNDFAGNCVYCNHCQPCPAGIDIASANRYLDIARLDKANIPPSVRQHYSHLAAHGGDCISCGSCEERCPFGVPVIENMAAAAQIFGE